MIRVSQSSELSFKKNDFACTVCLKQETGRITDHRTNLLCNVLQIADQFIQIHFVFVIQFAEKDILLNERDLQTAAQNLFIIELAHLNADFGEFVRIERGNTRLGGAKGILAKTLFFEFIKIDVIGHHHLAAVRNQKFRSRYSAVCQ